MKREKIKKIWRKVTPEPKKEEGMFGLESFIWWALGILVTFAIIWFVTQLNYGVAGMAWKGFLNLMRPENLFPDLLNLPNYEQNNPTGISGMMSGAVYLNGIILRDIVNGLVVLMFYLVGMVYLYSDLFEQYLGKFKSAIPKIIIALILAYGSLYVIQFLMILGKYAYMVLYNIHTGSLGLWQSPDFYERIGAVLSPPTISLGPINLGLVENFFMNYIWSFLSVSFSIMLLMVVAVRDVALAVLIVLIPIASILLMTPWTQQIGTRLWWLLIELIFLPFVMIIPLMLIGPVANRISFVIAGLVVSMGAIYLISKEPLVLSGMGFGRAGEHLSRGVTMGVGMGNMFGGMGMTRGTMGTTPGGGAIPGGGEGGLKGGISDKMGGIGGTGGAMHPLHKAHGMVSGIMKGGLESTSGHMGVPMGAGAGLGTAYAGYYAYQGLKKLGGKLKGKMKGGE